MTYSLPKSLSICGATYEIRSDFREILEIIEIVNDPQLKKQERGFLALLFFYTDFENMPPEHYQEALKQCFWFIDGGKNYDQIENKQPRLMDWEQDFPYIIAPVNRVLGHECRASEYLHWWTFLSAYMEIGECTFAQIVRIRDMKNRGKQFSKSDREWYQRNQKIVDLKSKHTSEDRDIFRKLYMGTNTD